MGVHRTFAPAEDQFIRENWSSMAMSSISAVLKMNHGTIKKRAIVLGLRWDQRAAVLVKQPIQRRWHKSKKAAKAAVLDVQKGRPDWFNEPNFYRDMTAGRA